MSSVSGMTVDTGVSGDLDESVTQRAVFEKRTADEQEEIQQNLQQFKETNEQAERELEKWDDSQVRYSRVSNRFLTGKWLIYFAPFNAQFRMT